MQALNKVVQDRLKELQMTPFALWRKLEDHMSKQTIYSFLDGSSELTTAKLERILDALDLTVVVRKKR